MALTTNEQLIIKHIGQNYPTKASLPNMIPSYSRVGSTAYSANWLSKTIGGDALIPIQYAYYFVINEMRLVMWDGLEYKDVNEPTIITQQELANMWN